MSTSGDPPNPRSRAIGRLLRAAAELFDSSPPAAVRDAAPPVADHGDAATPAAPENAVSSDQTAVADAPETNEQRRERLARQRLKNEHDTGTDIVELLTDFSWVHRRVELVRFVDQHTVLRQTSVDFTLPEEQTTNLRRLHPAVVPVGMLKKRDLSRFSMWDEEGRRLVMFTTEQNGYYAASALVALARSTRRKLGIAEDVPADILAALREVAKQPTRQAEALVGCLRNGVAAEEANGTLKAFQDRVDEDNAGLRTLVERLRAHEAIAKQLMSAKSLSGLAQELASQFIVMTELRNGDGNADTGRRRLLKYAYEEPPASYSPPGRRVMRWSSAMVCRAGLWPEKRTLDRVPVGTAHSYHVEVEAPDDIEFIGAALLAEDPGRVGEKPRRSRAEGTELQRVHLRVGNAPRAYSGPVWVRFRAVRAGFLVSALLTAWLVVALLHFGEPQLPKLTGSNLEAAATLLVALPTILAAYLLRSGEHQLASRLLFGPRMLLLGSAACCFVAAGALAGGFPDEDRDGYWAAAGDVALGLAAAQLLTYVLPYAPQAWGWAARKIKN